MRAKTKPLPSTAPTRAVLLAGALLVVITALAYSNSFSGPFLFDDTDSIVENRTIRNLGDLQRVMSPPTAEGITVSGRPLLNLSFAINYAISETRVWSYHAVNLLIHLLAGLTLMGVVRRTLLKPGVRERFGADAVLLAFTAGVLWAVHPLQTASVTYVVQRAESLMALFYLLTLYCFVRGTESSQPTAWFTGSVLACLAGMGSKEVMASAPLLVLLYDRTFVAGTFRAALRSRWPVHACLAGTWVLLAYLVISTGGRGGTAGFGAGASSWAYALTQAEAITHYLRLALWPHPLVFDYGTALSPWSVGIAVRGVLILLLLGAMLVALKRWPRAGFVAVTFFAILAPSSSVVPVITETMAEHRMYLALAPLMVGLVLVLHGRVKQQGVMFCLACAVVLAWLTFERNADYRSEERLWRDTIAKRPENPRAYQNLANRLTRAGRLDEAIALYQTALRLDPDYVNARVHLGIALIYRGRTDEAIASFREVLEIQPGEPLASYNLAHVLAGRGDLEGALHYYRQALEKRPGDVSIHVNMANTLLQAGRPSDAIRGYERALELDPNLAMAHQNLGQALFRQGEIDRAIQAYRKALAFDSRYADAWFNLAMALSRKGQFSEALDAFHKAIALQPRHVAARNGLAWLLATCPEATIRNGQRAVTLAEEADRLLGRNPRILQTLAAAYAEAGQFSQAVAAARQALSLSGNNSEMTASLTTQLANYESGVPFREPPVNGRYFSQ